MNRTFLFFFTVNPPGVVEDVQIHVSYDGNVDIGWKPPSDLGTVGVVNTYGIRWGKVQLEIDMMDFITLSSTAHVSTVQLVRYNLPTLLD